MLELGLPRSPRFLINTVILTILLFGSYYGLLYKSEDSLHKRLTEAYYKKFWTKPQIESSVGVSLQIVWPLYISNLVEREIVISLTNNTEDEIEPVVVVTAVFSETTSDAEPSPQWLIWQTESQLGDNGYNGRSILNLGTIPPEGQVTESVWVRVAPVGNAPDQIPFDAYVQWTYPNNTELKCETEEKTGANGEICILRVAPAPQATVSTLQTIWQGIVRVLLLPPLTNLFLPLLALFLSLSYEELRTTIANDFAGRNFKSDNGSEEERSNGGQHTPVSGNRSGQESERSNGNWQAKARNWIPYISGIFGLISLTVYTHLFLSLIVDVAVGLLNSDALPNLSWWIRAIVVVFTIVIIIYIQKQQKDGSRELVKTLEEPLSISIVQQDQEVNAGTENAQVRIAKLQQDLDDMRTSMQERVSRSDFDNWLNALNTEITGLKREIDELERSYSPENIQVITQPPVDRIVNLKGEWDKKIEEIEKQLSRKLNSETYKKYKRQTKKLETLVEFSLTSWADLQKVDELITRVEEYKDNYPTSLETAREYINQGGYWKELANYFNGNTHWEVKQRYQNRYEKLKMLFGEEAQLLATTDKASGPDMPQEEQ